MATGKALDGKSYAGNPHGRFDEGDVVPTVTPRCGSLLYKKVMIAACVLSMMAQAKTVLWHHFDERSPGETAQAADVFVNSASSEYGSGEAHSINTGTTLGTDPDFMPTFVRPCYIEPILDPVSGSVHANTAAINFRSAGTSSALAGGAVIIKNNPALVLMNYTVECFVCTTGGTFNVIAPIAGKIYGDWGFTSETWHIGVLQNGKIVVRCNTWLSSINAGSGTHVINDGIWHHVALTCSYNAESGESTYKVYVDYEPDFEKTVNSAPDYGQSTANFDNAIYIGGYRNSGRKFNGMIDELRISDEALQPTQFMRRALPPFVDADTLVWMPFDAENGAVATGNPNMISGLSAGFVSRGNVATPVCSGDVPSRTLRDNFDLPPAWGNATSLFVSTNGVSGNGTSVHLPAYAYFKTNLTAELFFKTAARVSGDEHQELVMISEQPFLQIMLCTNSPGRVWMIYRNMYGGVDWPGTWTNAGLFGSDLDDGRWHHLAAVYDADHSTLKLYIDYQLMTAINNVILSPVAVECGIGSRPKNESQHFHGWIDSVRFTQRVLAPEKFLSSTKRVLANDVAEMAFHAQFDNDYEAQSGDFIVTADAYSRGSAGCEEPVFSPEVLYPELLLDGWHGTCTKTNEASVYLNGSTVLFRSAPGLGGFDQTAEFFCKLSSLPALAGIVSVNADVIWSGKSYPRWALYADDGDVAKLRFRCLTVLNGVNTERYLMTDVPVSELVDGGWHHVAIMLQAVDGNTNTQITLYIDRSNRFQGTIAGTLYSAGNSSVVFGTSASTAGNMVGYIDEFRIMRGIMPKRRFLRQYTEPKGLTFTVR